MFIETAMFILPEINLNILSLFCCPILPLRVLLGIFLLKDSNFLLGVFKWINQVLPQPQNGLCEVEVCYLNLIRVQVVEVSHVA